MFSQEKWSRSLYVGYTKVTINILFKEFDFEIVNWYYKKLLYQTAIRIKGVIVIPTTKAGLYKVQIL